MTRPPAVLPRPGAGSLPDDTPRREPGTRRDIAHLLLFGDQFAVVAAVFAAGVTRELLGAAGHSFTIEVLPTLAMIPLVLVGLAVAGNYRPAGAGLGGDTFRRFLRGTAYGLVVIAAVSFAVKLNLSRLFVALIGGYLLLLGTVLRLELRRVAHKPGRDLSTQAFVVGTDQTSCHLAATLETGVTAAFRVLGHLHVGGPICDAAADRVIGTLDDLPNLLDQAQPDAVIASAASLSDDELRALYLLLEPTGTELIVYPSLVEVASRRLDVETVGPFPLLHLSTVRMTAGRRAAKRLLDVVVTLLALVPALPVMAIAAIAIRRDSDGPAFFRQERVGLDGETFTLLKLRTMVQDAEDQLDDLMELNEAGDGLFKIKQDPRVTNIGSFLRRWSIDELPQLLNVLAGHMSLVGPRPALPTEVEQHAPDTALRRHRLKPGITGYWQVSGRSEVAADEALRMDLYYVENWSMAFDLLILTRTVRAVLTSRGAY